MSKPFNDVSVAARPPEVPVRGAELTARSRLEQLFDPGTFVELDAEVQHRAHGFGMDKKRVLGDGVVTGFGDIDGRMAYAFAQDRSVLGGSLGEMHAQKITKMMDQAAQTGVPVIGINDSGGARIQEGVAALAGYGEIFRRNVAMSGVVPQVSLLMGPCAGGAVYSPALTDFVVMVDKKSYMFVTGPKVVRAVTSEDVDTETLGGGRIHAQKSGVAHFLVRSELEGLEVARRLLSYLPANNCERAPISPVAAGKTTLHRLAEVVPAQGNRPYDVADVVAEIFDAESFLEVRALFAPNLRCGFARLDGQPVGVVANNPGVMAGVLDIDASRKGARFVRTCNAFGLPIVTLVDVPGFLPGIEQEHAGIIDHGAKLAYAYCEASVPKLSVILRKAYGGAYIVMSSKHVGGDFNFAWPKAEIAVMGAAGAVEILYARDIAGADDQAQATAAYVDAYNQQFANPHVAAARGFVDAVITPESTRTRLAQALRATQNKRQAQPKRRNGNVPL